MRGLRAPTLRLTPHTTRSRPPARHRTPRGRRRRGGTSSGALQLEHPGPHANHTQFTPPPRSGPVRSGSAVTRWPRRGLSLRGAARPRLHTSRHGTATLFTTSRHSTDSRRSSRPRYRLRPALSSLYCSMHAAAQRACSPACCRAATLGVGTDGYRLRGCLEGALRPASARWRPGTARW